MDRKRLRFLLDNSAQTLSPPRFGAHLAFDAAFMPADRPTSAPTTLTKPDEMDWQDWASFLLMVAAEIEHSLLVQYLYAGYCLPDQPSGSDREPANAASLLTGWRLTISRIAREEMGHLITVQNLRTVLGLSASLDRQPLPYKSPLYPFPFELEPLSKHSLAKYVVSEMPVDPGVDLSSIIAEASGAAGTPVNRVGIIYATLDAIFSDPRKLTDSDLAFEAAAAYQVNPADWTVGGGDNLIIDAIRSRDDAVAAIRQISEQGEGTLKPPPGAPPSHFERFLEMYRNFPTHEWDPSPGAPTNPGTVPGESSSVIAHPLSLAWAKFGNVRYRMLLACIAHAVALPGATDGPDGRTPKGNLVDWAFEEMVGRSKAGLGRMFRMVRGLPLALDGGPGTAALPFEMPYTTELPSLPTSRWRLHLSLLQASAALAAVLRELGASSDLLDEYTMIDADRRTFVLKYLTD